MSIYIDADAVESAILKEYDKAVGVEHHTLKMVFEMLSAQPTADVVEVVHGEWIPNRFKTLQEDGWCECSVCGVGNKLYDRGVRKSDVPYIDGKPYELRNIANYCPNCGARMDGAE